MVGHGWHGRLSHAGAHRQRQGLRSRLRRHFMGRLRRVLEEVAILEHVEEPAARQSLKEVSECVRDVDALGTEAPALGHTRASTPWWRS